MMESVKEKNDAVRRAALEEVGARYLTPVDTRIFKGTFELMHVQYRDPKTGKAELYRGAYALFAFPVSSPKRYISLRHHDETEGDKEIGIIEDPMQFPPEVRELLGSSLANNYFEFEITRVLKIVSKYGLLLFDVETTEGKREFEMRWQQDRALSYGPRGKVLIDVCENRYVVPDLSELPKEDRERFVRFIYW
jgi:hypothetical protein